MKNGKNIENEPAYITKRILLSATRKAFIQASEKAMEIVGYVIKVKDGWLVCENLDGTIEKISKLRPAVKSREVILD